jgi:membrane carboxypeptidase/penicillin-binding protein PbpC
MRGTLSAGDGRPIASPTPDVESHEVCALSGLAPHEACLTRAADWLPAGAELPRCDWHHAGEDGIVTVWPERYVEWARGAGLIVTPDLTVRPSPGDAAPHRHGRPTPERALRITSPGDGATFLLDPTLRPEFQTLSLRIAGAAPGPIEWFVDGRPLGVSRDGAPVRWPLARGEHIITARDASGRSAEADVIVR